MIDLTLGFIGTGGIASAMVRGFCSSPDFSGRINLTVHKNREKADALKKLFPDRISVHESNQTAVDDSDVVFICVLPQQHEAVVRAGEHESGITIHYIDDHYDEGAIIFQASCPLSPSDTPDDVARKVHALEYAHYPRVIEQVLQSI